MSLHPALQIDRADHDLALAVVDDYAPLAAEEQGQSLLVFFQTAAERDGASAAVAHAMPGAAVHARDVDDEDWARRSQEHLAPVRVGSITITAPAPAPAPSPPAPQPPVIIQPSMGFGTGHHATTRLCLAALQTLDLRQATVLDVGTGSGVLAIVARRLGAVSAVGIDADPDAVQSARENLPLNPQVDRVTFDQGELGRDHLSAADLVVANLTGALLCRTARDLMDLVNPGGHLIVSGLMKDERDDVRAALADMRLVWEAHEEEWVGLCLAHTGTMPVKPERA